MNDNKKYLVIYKDMFNIYNLIIKINPGYRLYFNNKNKKFLIVNIFNNFEICYTFNSFSKNILKELQFSSIQNIKTIIQEIENSNQKIKSEYFTKSHETASSKLVDTIHLMNRSTTLTQDDLNKIIGG